MSILPPAHTPLDNSLPNILTVYTNLCAEADSLEHHLEHHIEHFHQHKLGSKMRILKLIDRSRPGNDAIDPEACRKARMDIEKAGSEEEALKREIMIGKSRRMGIEREIGRGLIRDISMTAIGQYVPAEIEDMISGYLDPESLLHLRVKPEF